MKAIPSLLAATLVAALVPSLGAKTVAIPADVQEAFDQCIANQKEAYNKAKENYFVCRAEVGKYDEVLERLRKLSTDYETVRFEFSGYSTEIDGIREGSLAQDRVDSLTNQFEKLQIRVRENMGRLNDLTEESAGGPFNSANAQFEQALRDFLEASRKADELTYIPGTIDQYPDLAAKYHLVFGMYGAVNLDNVNPDERTRLGALRLWRDEMHGTVNTEMRNKLDDRGARLAGIANDSAEIGEALGHLRSKLSLPDGWEGDLHDFYMALQALTRPRQAKVSFLHRFNDDIAEPFDDLPDHVADMNKNLILPAECNAANMRRRMPPGWKFAGWALKDGTPVESDEYLLTGPVSLYALRKEIPVKVTFLNEEGESVSVTNLTRFTPRTDLERPADPAPRWGWKFLGWKEQGKENLFARWGTPLDVIVKPETPNERLFLVFEPVWETVPLTLAFEDGDDTQVHKVTVLDMVPDVPLVDHPGWTSLGWASSEGSANADVKAGAPVLDYLQEPATKAVFHAVRKTIPYTVKFLSRTADSAEPVPFGEPRVGNVLQSVDAPAAPVLDHYTFEGWRVSVADGILYDFSQPVAADTTLVAAWKPVPYTIRLGSAEGELADYDAGEPWTIERLLTAPPEPSAGEKYEFLHWTRQAPAEGSAWLLMPDDEAPAPFAFGAPVASDIDLYPVFRHRCYTVTFKINNSRTWKKVEKVLHGDTVEDPGAPETKGAKLDLRYWQAVPGPSAPYDFSTPVTKNLVLSTIWDQKHQKKASKTE